MTDPKQPTSNSCFAAAALITAGAGPLTALIQGAPPLAKGAALLIITLTAGGAVLGPVVAKAYEKIHRHAPKICQETLGSPPTMQGQGSIALYFEGVDKAMWERLKDKSILQQFALRLDEYLDPETKEKFGGFQIQVIPLHETDNVQQFIHELDSKPHLDSEVDDLIDRYCKSNFQDQAMLPESDKRERFKEEQQSEAPIMATKPNLEMDVVHRDGLGHALAKFLCEDHYIPALDSYFERYYNTIKGSAPITETNVLGFCEIWTTYQSNPQFYIDRILQFFNELADYPVPYELPESTDVALATQYSIFTDAMLQLSNIQRSNKHASVELARSDTVQWLQALRKEFDDNKYIHPEKINTLVILDQLSNNLKTMAILAVLRKLSKSSNPPLAISIVSPPTLVLQEGPRVAIFCPLDVEFQAMRSFVTDLTPIESGDTVLWTAKLGTHSVVIATFLATEYGSTNTAVLLGQVRSKFPSIKHFLTTGVAGALFTTAMVKGAELYPRLGDLVIARTIWRYDLGRLTKDGIEAILPPQHGSIGLATRAQAFFAEGKSPSWLEAIDIGLKQNASSLDRAISKYEWIRPSEEHDIICDTDGVELEHPRVRGRYPNEPANFLAPIAVGDAVLKDGKVRENLAAKGYRATEMESYGAHQAAGDAVQVISIRGIADYSDGTKNKLWQPYASIVAAAFVAVFLKSYTLA